MSRRQWILWSFAACTLVVAFAVSLATGQPPPDGRGEAASDLGATARMLDSLRAAHLRENRVEARRESPIAVPGHGRRRSALAALAWHAERAEPVARRFFAAFSLYELGKRDRRVTAELRATATSTFARELTDASPRTPASSTRPARARLGALEFVARKVDSRRQRLLSGELVGEVERGGRRSPIAIELVRQRSSWRVGGLGQ